MTSSPVCSRPGARRRRLQASSTRSRPFFDGFAPYVIAVMSRTLSGSPDGETGIGTTSVRSDRPADGGASSMACALSGRSSGACARRLRSSGRCHSPCRPGRFPAEVASKRIAPGRGQSSAAVVLEYRTRARRGRRQCPPGGGSRRPGPLQVCQHQRPDVRGRAGPCDHDARAGAAQRPRELLVGDAQALG